MNNHNKAAYEKFLNYLSVRNTEALFDLETDIRKKIVSERFLPWNIGFTNNNMSNGYSANIKTLFPNNSHLNDKNFGDSRNFIISGTININADQSHKGALEALQHYRYGDNLILIEQGFLASTHSWSESFKQKNKDFACLGYVYDDISHYYMTDYPNRLIQRLNSTLELSADEKNRAGTLINKIVALKISKYNSQPIVNLKLSEGYNERILVCDQSYADASTYYGNIDDLGFENMLISALNENPEAEIIIKTHPDTYWESDKGRTGYYNHLTDTGRIKIIRKPINPYSLFEVVDKVYVGTSQLGLEALFAGKQVVTFGCPFYAGWGLTDDRQIISHRHRKRSLEDIFHFFYIWYTIYHVPGFSVPSTIDDVIEYIVAKRPVKLPLTNTDINATPKVSVIIPVFNVEKYIKECIKSIQNQSLREIEIITINDKSPDNSQLIIDELASTDPRIKSIVLNENIGQGFARNIGIKKARGEYILFLDSDDYLATDTYLEKSYLCAIQDNADMVRGRKIYELVEDKDGNFIKHNPDKTEIHFQESFHNKKLSNHFDLVYNRHFWNWMYKRSFLKINNIAFLTTQWEEKPFLLLSLIKANRISGLNINAFVYRVREDSTARRNKTIKDSFNQLSNFEQVVQILHTENAFLKDNQLYEVAKFQISQLLHFLFFGFAYNTVLNSGDKEALFYFLTRASKATKKTDITGNDLSIKPMQLTKELINKNAYKFLIECLRSEKFNYISDIVNLKPIEQKTLYNEFRKTPLSSLEDDFQNAINFYARNDLVKTNKLSTNHFSRPKIILHIGTTKTGSTYIQHFLEQNRPALLRKGIWYPEKGLFWQDNRHHKQSGHSHITTEAANNSNDIKNHIESGLALSDNKIHTIILSSEAYFLNHNSLKIANYFSEYKIEIIGYFRRQDEWANSQYAEFVAGGAIGKTSLSFEDWLTSDLTTKRLDYFSFLESWRDAIGIHNIHARPYNRDAFDDGDIISDFLIQLGIDDCLDLPRPKKLYTNNFPFNSEHVTIIRRLNKANWKNTNIYLQFIEDITNKISLYREKNNIDTQKPNFFTSKTHNILKKSITDTNTKLVNTYIHQSENYFLNIEYENNNFSEGIDKNEIEIIYNTFDEYQNTVSKTHFKNDSFDNNKSIKKDIQNKKKIKTADSIINIKETKSYKFFSKVASPLLSSSKKRKLTNNPDAFFIDSKHSLVKNIYILSITEQHIKSDLLPSLELMNKTITYSVIKKLSHLFLNTKKTNKLTNNPNSFLSDIKGKKGKLVRGILMFESYLKQDIKDITIN